MTATEKKAARSRAYRAANTEKIAVKKRAEYAANREKILPKKRDNYAANRAKYAAQNRAYRLANHAQILEGKRVYRLANPEKIAVLNLRRRARRLSNGVFAVTVAEIAALLAEPCYICQSAPSVHVDHVVPLSRGGRHSIGNLAGACADCNLSKNDRYLIEHKRRRLAA